MKVVFATYYSVNSNYAHQLQQKDICYCSTFITVYESKEANDNHYETDVHMDSSMGNRAFCGV